MAEYQLIARESRFNVQAFAEGMLSSLGHNPTMAIRNFSGRIGFDPQAADKAALEVTVQPDSLEVLDDLSKKDRLEIEKKTREEVLENAAYPEIVYQSVGVESTVVGEQQYRLKFSGTLSLHGIKKPLAIELLLRQGQDDVRLQGEFRLKQSSYNIKRVSAVAGAIKVKDELRFSYEIVGRKAAQ